MDEEWLRLHAKFKNQRHEQYCAFPPDSSFHIALSLSLVAQTWQQILNKCNRKKKEEKYINNSIAAKPGIAYQPQ